jgi:SAM-dependent methyltransferase
MSDAAGGVRFGDFQAAPNQGANPGLYEVENRALDPDGVVLDAMRQIAPWRGKTLVDLGCGSGFWLSRYADEAGTVIGVEPDPRLVEQARGRDERVQVLAGSAEHMPLPDDSVDVIHARFAYFWPPHCEPGLVEALRVLRLGGSLVVVDNDHRAGEFAGLLRAAGGDAQGTADATDAWWAERGAARTAVMSRWAFDSRPDFEDVLRMEFPEVADSWLATHGDAVGLSYGYVLFSVQKRGSDHGSRLR